MSDDGGERMNESTTVGDPMSKKTQLVRTVDDLALVALALDAIPPDVPRYEAPAFVEQHVRESGGSEGAASLARAIVRHVLRSR
jgi:hypothetical protein